MNHVKYTSHVQRLPNYEGTTVQYINGKAYVVNTKFDTRTNVNIPRVVKTQDQIKITSEEQDEVSKMESGTIEESHSEEVFAQYRCKSIPSSYNCVVHPGNIVEAGSLVAQDLPIATYDLLKSLPEDTIKEGKISDLQMEGILFACQRHQMILPDGKRAGFFLGDGTGVGKGRQIAGIIFDNICRNRKKHVWFSISSDLRHDAQRDLQDIGCYVTVIDGCQQLDKETKAFGLVSDFREGVLFSTYSTLVSSSQKDTKKSCRLDQLITWCGGRDFDGCLIFDESHKAKHFVPGKEKSSTKVALAVTNIQRQLSKARVVYCSATGVTDVKNMAFMERLGLWGTGTTFQNFESFLDSLSKRGLGALEMLSMEMKAAGMYVSRGLSYQEAEFQTVEACLTEPQTKVYDKAVQVWHEVKRCLAIALSRTGTFNSRIWTQYWGCHQRFFKQLCMSMKVPEIIKKSKEALSNGHCVVLGLQTTGEASMDVELDNSDGDLKGFISLTREILRRFVLQFFPTEVHLPDQKARIDEWCVRAKSMLCDIIEKINLPDSPLDEMIDQLGGPSCVAEMTGRKGFIGRYRKEQKPLYIPRTSGNNSGTDSVNVQERNAFMNGDKLVAIISDAASTGISLHADMRVCNTRRRVHITAELPWSADKAVQQLGRSHRSNQRSGPIYQLVTSNLGGERRFAAAVARRLQSLGAITKGDRRAATGADLTQFNFDTPYGRQSLKMMYEAIHRGRICSGVTYSAIMKCLKDEDSEDTSHQFNEEMKQCLMEMDVLAETSLASSVSDKNLKDVGKFLNRILGLEVKKQNLIFSYFCQCLDAATEAAKREGRYNDGVTDLKGNSIVMNAQPRNVFKEVQLGASITKHITISVDRGVPFIQAHEKLKENSHCNDNGFYRSKRPQYGKMLYLLAVQKERATHLFTVTRPNTGMSPFEEEKADLLHKYERLEPNEAERGWTEQYEQTKDHCIHGDTCKHKGSCKIGSRINEVHLLTGRILSILPALEFIVARFAHALKLPREQRNLRVVRVELDNGERLIGLRYPHVLISDVEQYLKEQRQIKNEKMDLIPEVKVEEETPVNEKSRQKALSKPLTLHKFFKTKPLSVEPCVDEKDDNVNVATMTEIKTKQQKNEDLCTGEEFLLTEVGSTSKGNPEISPPSISESLRCNRTTPQRSSSRTKIVSRTNGSTTSNNPGSSYNHGTAAIPLIKSKPLKRTASEENRVNVNKRHKQANIFNMMMSKKTKGKSCPICKKDLKGLSNSGVNIHVDKCVIK